MIKDQQAQSIRSAIDRACAVLWTWPDQERARDIERRSGLALKCLTRGDLAGVLAHLRACVQVERLQAGDANHWSHVISILGSHASAKELGHDARNQQQKESLRAELQLLKPEAPKPEPIQTGDEEMTKTTAKHKTPADVTEHVAALRAMGWTWDAIARPLGISSTHLNNMLKGLRPLSEKQQSAILAIPLEAPAKPSSMKPRPVTPAPTPAPVVPSPAPVAVAIDPASAMRVLLRCLDDAEYAAMTRAVLVGAGLMKGAAV